MATTNRSRETELDKATSFGLLANGSAGQWEIEIDESLKGKERWWMQIEGKSISLNFEIQSPAIVGEMLQVFDRQQRTNSKSSRITRGPLLLGKDKSIHVSLLPDDEYADRFFIVVGPIENPVVRFAMGASDSEKIAEALRQVNDDIDDA